MAKAKPKAKAKPVATKKPAAKKPAPKKAAPKKAAANKPAANKPAANKPAANKPAPSKPAPAPAATVKADLPSTITLLRGIPLVDASLEQRAKTETLSGMSPGEIAAIDFGGKPLSPALAHWLSKDREMFTLGTPSSLMEMIETEAGDFAGAFVDLARFLKEPVVLFEGWGSDSRRFIYLGATDEHGEYPVFTIDTDDNPFACLNGPVDVWLAQQAGALDDEGFYGQLPTAYEPTRAAFAKACFGGNVSFVDGQFWKTLEG